MRTRTGSAPIKARPIPSPDRPNLSPKWAAAGDRIALIALPAIGEGLANLIIDYVKTGESALLLDLEGRADPARAFRQVPGIGRTLARRIQDELNITTLEELEIAAHDGRLATVEGFGAGRVKAVQASLGGMLSDSARRRARQRTAPPAARPDEPAVAVLLEVDGEYRRRAAAGDLKTIAPRRFNPEGKAWLPVLTTRRGDWSFTALFSNTARAHELNKTDDWVVIYFERAGDEERQRTVVTETKGPLEGKRVVRGREAETRKYYQETSDE
jgi:DNA polymerase (family X)